ncbi:hypothetical protein ACFFIS_09650 [Virgibacillus soli]|uniref:Uncharacterized protein n=1 Tax=Paracerasibacillus soli TaxID=480284 RepID=A0ABU5CUU7_9BACI|nr:hypothetical protein [Virgibacillus soli]MDY0410143.1 hypothetical protein [Virgibacillus soli]
MGLKGKLGILVLGCAVAVIALLIFTQKEPYSTETVMDSVWDKYDVQSTMIGEESGDGKSISTLWVEVYNEDDIPKVKNYLEKNLSQDDLEYYKIDVSRYEPEEETS